MVGNHWDGFFLDLDAKDILWNAVLLKKCNFFTKRIIIYLPIIKPIGGSKLFLNFILLLFKKLLATKNRNLSDNYF